jgi:deferrochelatase/peroxidase EfeB
MLSPTNCNDIQANVLKSHNRNFCCFIFCRWKPGMTINEYRNWVKAIGRQVTSYQQQREAAVVYKSAANQRQNLDKAFVNNLALTHAAYQLMHSNSIPIDFEFRKGMHNRRYLPDYYGKKTADHIGSFMQKEHHALICLANDSKQLVLELKQHLLELPVFRKVVTEHRAEFIQQRRKAPGKDQLKGELKGPFDFKDDLSKPPIASEEADNYHFAFVHQREKDEPDLHGTYLAAQKIICHVNAFNSYAAALKAATGVATLSHAKALLVGRFPNGTPLDLYAAAQKDKHAQEENNFDYSHNNGQTKPDPLGLRCPLHAHIRSVNPRKNSQLLTPIVRRGISYNDQRSRKQVLLFLSFQASVKNNLRPLYDNMLRGRFNDHQLDALVYQAQQDFLYREATNTYVIGKDGSSPQRIKHPRSQERLSSFVGSYFYYLPSMTYLSAPH